MVEIVKNNRFNIGSKVLVYIIDNEYSKESFAKKLGWTPEELNNVLYGYIDSEEEYQAKINYVLNMINMSIDELSEYYNEYYDRKIKEEEQIIFNDAINKEISKIDSLVHEDCLDEILDKCGIECEDVYEREAYRKVLTAGYQLGKADTLDKIKNSVDKNELSKDTRNTLLKVISYLCENIYHELPITTLEKLIFFAEITHYSTLNESLFNTDFINRDGNPKMIGLYEYLSDLDNNGLISIIKKSYTTVIRCNYPSVRMNYGREIEALKDVSKKFKGMSPTEIANYNECDKALSDVLNGVIIPENILFKCFVCLYFEG
jgi:hypothetical protein